MISMLILAVTLKASTAGDFFPLKPGSTFTYEEKGSSVQLTRTIGDALDMGGVTVTPITDRTIGSSAATTYYRVDSDQVLIVGYDVKHMMVTPMPLFKVGSDKVRPRRRAAACQGRVSCGGSARGARKESRRNRGQAADAARGRDEFGDFRTENDLRSWDWTH